MRKNRESYRKLFLLLLSLILPLFLSVWPRGSLQFMSFSTLSIKPFLYLIFPSPFQELHFLAFEKRSSHKQISLFSLPPLSLLSITFISHTVFSRSLSLPQTLPYPSSLPSVPFSCPSKKVPHAKTQSFHPFPSNPLPPPHKRCIVLSFKESGSSLLATPLLSIIFISLTR